MRREGARESGAAATDTPPDNPRDGWIVFDDRPSDSRFVERVWRSHSERAGTFDSMAATHWGIVVTRLAGQTTLTVRGPETRATRAACPADGEWFGLRFELGTFMPSLAAHTLMDRQDLTLPDATSRSFWLHGSAWEYPSYENAEIFVRRLVRAGLLVADRGVEDAVLGRPQALSTRSEQRRVLRVTGMTRGTIRQIRRARHATNLLRDGAAIADVVHRAGYFDHAHLCRSLRHFVGQTPTQIAAGRGQLSLLCKTESVREAD